ncbi:MAG: hypothetical protein IJL06_04365 [Kiritimatiellae bacterium]|nr:hypothetical protein [Kiritimatiellia bacterium]
MAETITSGLSGEIPFTETLYTKKGVDQLIATVLKGGIMPKGSIAFANLPTPAASNLGWMYNVSTAFTTTSSFVEGAGHAFPAGTNIYVASPEPDVYKFDVMPGEGPQPSSDTPAPNGTASPGQSMAYARADHVHQTDVTRQAKITASGLLKGDGNGGVAAAIAGTDYVAPVSGKGLSTNDYTTEEKQKLAGVASGAQVNTVNGVMLQGASQPLAPDSSTKVVTLPCAVATGQTGATAGLMSAADKKNLSDVTTAAGNLFSALSTLTAEGAALHPASITNANALKTALVTLVGYLKQYAGAADANDSTSFTPA